MADRKETISQRPTATTMDGSELVPFVQGGLTKKGRADLVQPIVSLQWFGVVGDGVNDDYAAIQAALTFASANSARVVSRAGRVYNLSQQLVISGSNVELDLQGSTLRRMYNTSPTGAGVISIVATSPAVYENITIRNGTLDVNCDAFPTAANGITVNGYKNFLFENLTILDVNDFHAIDFGRGDGMTIRRVRAMGFVNTGAQGDRSMSEAFQLDPGLTQVPAGSAQSNVTIQDCYVGPNPANGRGSFGAAVGNHGSVDAAPAFTNVKVLDSTFDSCGYAGVRTFADWRDIKVRGNRFSACARGVHVTPRSNVAQTVFQMATGVLIEGNTFDATTDIGVLFAAASEFTTSSPNFDRHKDVTIVGNVFRNFTAGTGRAIDLRWVERATVTGNTLFNGVSGIVTRFCSGVTVTGNAGRGITNNFLLINEVTETTFAGTGKTRDITVAANVLYDIKFRAVHVNCAARGVLIESNECTDVGWDGTTARPVFEADSAAQRVITRGNQHLQDVAATLPSFLVSYSATVVNSHIQDNFGQATVLSRHQGTGTLRQTGTGTPLAVITAPPGSQFTRTDGGAGTGFYIKETATDATGWVGK